MVAHTHPKYPPRNRGVFGIGTRVFSKQKKATHPSEII